MRFLPSLLCPCLAFVSLACAPASRSGSPALDVVIIVLDTTRADRLGAYGNTRAVSPSLDRFASESTLFERAWSVSSWTLPAHASLLTGQYPTAHGARMTRFTDSDSNGKNPAHLREAAVTLAELLTERSYHTAAFAGAGWLSPEFGLLQGYEVKDAENNRSLPAAEITDRALRWLAGVPDDEPLHLLVNYFDPHWPYEPLPGYDHFARGREDVKVPTLGELFAGSKPNEAQLAKMLDLYDGEIQYMDEHVGRLLDGLRASDRYDDAMIIVIADHGELLGEHGDLGHGAWLWEELMRVPLIVHYPGGRGAGTRVEHSVSTVDVLTWIGAELDLELPDDVNGLAVGERTLALAEEWPNRIFRAGGLDRDLVAGVQWPWKLIVSNRGERQLFRLDRDPLESDPVVDAKTDAEVSQAIYGTRSTLVAPAPGPPREMSPEALEQLRELGYVE